nr:uncharacterized protein LOC124494755 [Dermatophagoides farinae]
MESVNSCWHLNLNNNWYGQESLPSDFNIASSSSSSSSPNKSPSSRSSKTLNRTSPIDSFVKFDYWSLDLEYLICCLVPIIWSFWGVLLIIGFILADCFQQHQLVFTLSSVWYIINILEQILTILALTYARKTEEWLKKLYILDTTIGSKIFLTIIHFIWMMIVLMVEPCGHICSSNYFNNDKSDDNEFFGHRLTKWIQFYDIQMVAITHAWCSLGELITAMLLSIKRNDLKIYSLWRMDRLDDYIKEIQTFM